MNRPIQIHILRRCVCKKVENHIIARVTKGNSTPGNCVAIEKIPGRIPTNSTMIAIRAIIRSTTGYVIALINLFANELIKTYSWARLRKTVTRFHDVSHALIIATSEGSKYIDNLLIAFVNVLPSFIEIAILAHIYLCAAVSQLVATMLIASFIPTHHHNKYANSLKNRSFCFIPNPDFSV